MGVSTVSHFTPGTTSMAVLIYLSSILAPVAAISGLRGRLRAARQFPQESHARLRLSRRCVRPGLLTHIRLIGKVKTVQQHPRPNDFERRHLILDEQDVPQCERCTVRWACGIELGSCNISICHWYDAADLFHHVVGIAVSGGGQELQSEKWRSFDDCIDQSGRPATKPTTQEV